MVKALQYLWNRHDYGFLTAFGIAFKRVVGPTLISDFGEEAVVYHKRQPGKPTVTAAVQWRAFPHCPHGQAQQDGEGAGENVNGEI